MQAWRALENESALITAQYRYDPASLSALDMEDRVRVTLISPQGEVLYATEEAMYDKHIPSPVIQQILEKGTYAGLTDLDGLYSSNRYIAGLPVRTQLSPSLTANIGLVLVSGDTGGLSEMWRSTATIFFFAAVVVLLIAVVASSITSAHQARPLTEMAEAARKFGRGEFDVRVNNYKDRCDEIGELAEAFNSMANSLAKVESQRADFIANVSHEIKTPLTCIIGAAEALEDEELTPELRHNFMEMLRSNSHRLNNLVRDILSLAALEKRQLDPTRDFAPVEVASVAVNAINLTRPRAAAANIVISLAGDASLPIKGDPILLEQALVNLLENALKYSGSDRITVTLRRDGPEAVIEVADHGIGIPPDHRKRIFERFYRVDGSRSRELGGTGLGLAIVKHICQLHHGSAEVDETPGGGCTFRLRLPLSGSPAGNPAC